ncbi:unnamed protein product, partial [Acidithrix sp. C25]
VKDKRSGLAKAALALVAIAWGASPVATRFLHRGGGVVLLMEYRFVPLVVVILLLLVVRSIKRRDFKVLDLGGFSSIRVIGVSLLGGLGYNGLVSAALTYSHATIVGISLTTEPIWILILGTLFIRKRLSRGLLLGVALAIVGTVVAAVAAPGGEAGGSNAVVAVILGVLATFCWGLYSVLTQDWKISALDMTSWMVICVSPIVIVAQLLLHPVIPQLNSVSVVISILVVSVISTLLAITGWNFGVSILGSSLAAPFLYLQPISSVLLALVFLGETPTLFEVVGLVIIVLGVAISQYLQQVHVK